MTSGRCGRHRACPSAICAPKSSTTMSSQTFITKFMSCSTRRMRHAPVVGQPPHEVGELGGLGVAETGRRLVEQQHAGLGGDGPGDGQQAALAVGEVLHRRGRGRPRCWNSRIAATTSPGSGGSTRVHEVAQVRAAGRAGRRRRAGCRARSSPRTARATGTTGDSPARARLAGDSRIESLAVEQRRRRVRAGVKPVMASIADVLPAPLGPISPVIRARVRR